MAKITKNSDLGTAGDLDSIGTVTVVHAGRVYLRSSPAMEEDNILGTASNGDTFAALDTLEEGGHRWYYLEGDKYIRADERLVTIK